MPEQSFLAGNLSFSHNCDTVPSPEKFMLHIHDKYEIYCFLSGDASYLVEGNAYHLEPGSIIIIRPSEIHMAKILSAVPYERYVLNFSGDLLRSIDPQGLLLKPFDERALGQRNLYTPAEFSAIKPKDFLDMMKRPAKDSAEKQMRILSLLPALLEEVYTVFSKGEHVFTPLSTLSERLFSYVNAHLTENLALDSLAKQFFVSPSQINRIFKRYTGISVGGYINTKRLMYAKSLLGEGKNASEVCNLCGFNDYSNFYRAYKKQFGVSPSAHSLAGR